MHGEYIGEGLEKNRPNLLGIVFKRWGCDFL